MRCNPLRNTTAPVSDAASELLPHRSSAHGARSEVNCSNRHCPGDTIGEFGIRHWPMPTLRFLTAKFLNHSHQILSLGIRQQYLGAGHGMRHFDSACPHELPIGVGDKKK